MLTALTIFGVVRIPIEKSLRSDLIEHHLLLPPPANDTLSAMSQSSLMGTLGGLRSMVAVYLTLKAYEHFSYTEWGELNKTYGLITGLEPRVEEHWVSWVWHIGINAVAYVQNEPGMTDQERKRLFDFYTQEAIKVGRRGIEQLPQSSAIRGQLAEVYREKLKDNCAVAQLYKEMIGLPDSLEYVVRFHGYFLAKCEGKEQEAYDYLMNLYRVPDKKHHLPTLIQRIKELEVKLKIPITDWIPEANPDELLRRQLRSGEPLPGGVRLP